MTAEFGVPDKNWLCLLAGKRTFTDFRLFKFNDIEVEKRKKKMNLRSWFRRDLDQEPIRS